MPGICRSGHNWCKLWVNFIYVLASYNSLRFLNLSISKFLIYNLDWFSHNYDIDYGLIYKLIMIIMIIDIPTLQHVYCSEFIRPQPTVMCTNFIILSRIPKILSHYSFLFLLPAYCSILILLKLASHVIFDIIVAIYYMKHSILKSFSSHKLFQSNITALLEILSRDIPLKSTSTLKNLEFSARVGTIVAWKKVLK